MHHSNDAQALKNVCRHSMTKTPDTEDETRHAVPGLITLEHRALNASETAYRHQMGPVTESLINRAKTQ